MEFLSRTVYQASCSDNQIRIIKFCLSQAEKRFRRLKNNSPSSPVDCSISLDSSHGEGALTHRVNCTVTTLTYYYHYYYFYFFGHVLP